MTADELVAGLRKAHERMTPGPWTPGRPDMLSYDGDGRGPWKQVYWDDPDAEMHMGEKLKGVVGRMEARPVDDACGSAWLRNHASAIADELERMRAEVERLRQILSQAFCTINKLTTHSIRDSKLVEDDAIGTLTSIAFELEGEPVLDAKGGG